MLVAATRILDEADLVEPFVRHTAAHVGHHLLLDNGSRDGTREILDRLAEEGLPITVLTTGSVAFTESEALTDLFSRAVRDHDADWVVFLDADEFIDDRQIPGGIAALLGAAAACTPPVRQMQVALADYVAIVHDVVHELCVPKRIQWRAERGDNRKTIVNARVAPEDVTVGAGGHMAWSASRGEPLAPCVFAEGLTWAHYPERNTWQWMVKVVRGWAKVLASGRAHAEAGMAGHYAEAFGLLRDHPEHVFFNEHLMSFKNERPGLIHDAIEYRGGELRYTQPLDARVQAARALMGFVEALATRHGQLLDSSADARALSGAWDAPR